MEEKLNQLAIQESNQSSEVGIIYHPQMFLHAQREQDYEYCDPFQIKSENPYRLISIIDHIKKQNLHKKCQVINEYELRKTTEIQQIHDEQYINYINNLKPKEGRFSEASACTYYNNYTQYTAELAYSASLIAVDKIYQQQWKRVYAPIRPPGHHADVYGLIKGFCFYNNIAIAARYAQQTYGVKRVFILDWDVHHGDSTQSKFYNDPSVLYMSLHRFDKGEFCPGEYGGTEYIGEGQGQYYNINVTWNCEYDIYTPNTHDLVYVYERFILPILIEFNPELLLISSGFDSCVNDPLGGIEYNYDGYGYITKKLMEFMNQQNIIVFLEGGYNLENLQTGSEAVLRALLNEEFPFENSEWLKSKLTYDPRFTNEFCEFATEDKHEKGTSTANIHQELSLSTLSNLLGFRISGYSILSNQIQNDFSCRFLTLTDTQNLFNIAFGNCTKVKSQILEFIDTLLTHLFSELSHTYFCGSCIYVMWNSLTDECYTKFVGLNTTGKLNYNEKDLNLINALEELKKFINSLQ